MRRASLLALSFLTACGGAGSTDETGSDTTGGGVITTGGHGGASGHAGKSGASGSGGTSGPAGAGGSLGVSGSSGQGGTTAGHAGSSGSSGTGGTGASGGSSAGHAGASGMSGAAGTGGMKPCAKGSIVCDGFNSEVCDGNGGFDMMQACAVGCADGIGCVNCQPNTGSCNGNVASHCPSDGSAIVTETCDETIGLTCDPTTFTCTGPCNAAALGNSYIGCEYWPTTVANVVWSNFDFAVAIANPAGAKPAMITIDRGGTPVTTATVMPGDLQIIKLPWVPELKGPDCDSIGEPAPEGPTRLVTGGAYRVRSTTPVSAYQFNALQYTLTPSDPGYGSCPGLASGLGCNSFTNDASLLLPTNALTGTYRVFTYQAWDQGQQPAYAAIIGTADGTNVTFTSSTNIQAGGPIGALSAGQTANFTLNTGDVIELMTTPTSADISGSQVMSDKPVQVMAGLPCTFIPEGVQACDHIEETILPVETLGTSYILTAPQTPDGVKLHEVRIHGIVDGTTVTIDPPSSMGASITLSAGQTVSLGVVSGDFSFTGTNRFYVSQYMVGGNNFPDAMNDGDPSQSNGVPVQQYRTDYTFLAPDSYTTNMVNVSVMMGATVTLDGTPIPASSFTAIGNSGFGVARVPLSMTQVHHIQSSSQFGIVVYGYGSYTSYMYPGGLNLEKL